MQSLLEIRFGKDGFAEGLSITYRYRMQSVEGLTGRMTPQNDRFHRFVVNLPITKGNDHGLEPQSFRFVYREDPDRILPIGRGDGLALSCLVPPFEEMGEVAPLLLLELGYLVEQSLQEHLLSVGEEGVKKPI